MLSDYLPTWETDLFANLNFELLFREMANQHAMALSSRG